MPNNENQENGKFDNVFTDNLYENTIGKVVDAVKDTTAGKVIDKTIDYLKETPGGKLINTLYNEAKERVEESIAAKDINTANSYDMFKSWQKNMDPYAKGIPVGFFTTTGMNFVETNSEVDAYFSFIRDTYPALYNSMSFICPGASSTSPFIKLLYNHFLGLAGGKDVTLKTLEIGETRYGYKQTLPGPMVDSVTGDTFTVRFKNEKNLLIIHAIKLWMDYIENVTRGMFVPDPTMVKYAEIDYVSTFYYFVLDYDFSTILYFCRYVGVAPISNPLSALVSSGPDDRELADVAEVEFVYSYKEDLDPEILIDFNKLSQNDFTKLRGTSNTSVTYSIPGYENNPDELENSIKTGNPIICRKVMRDASGVEPKIKYKLVFQ